MNKQQILERLREALNLDYIQAQSIAGNIQPHIRNLRVSHYEDLTLGEINSSLQYAYKASSEHEVKEYISDAIEALDTVEVYSDSFDKSEYKSISKIINHLEYEILDDVSNLKKNETLAGELKEFHTDIKKILEKAKEIEEKMKKS